MVRNLFPEKKVKKFLEFIVQKEHVAVSDFKKTSKSDYKVIIGDRSVFFAIRHSGEKGILRGYVSKMIDALAETHAKLGTPGYAKYKKKLKKIARNVLGF